ncbi:MAG: response regulator [Desulfovibrio sp.]|nr:response regulator [Desulfovibrio sp.]MBI4961227.1 response regulator [Desulfovibrio sp.]
MSDKVLFVDDEQLVLDSFRRTLHAKYSVFTAVGPEAGLEMLQSGGPFAVVVSDLKMPGMDGFEFLAKVREQAPDTVCIMLTGFADLEAAVKAVDAGNIFQLLTKPCPTETLAASIDAGIKQYRMVISERELLQGTLTGTIRVLTEALSVANPFAFGREQRIKALVAGMAEILNKEVSWELDLAAMLSQIGCMGLPPKVLEDLAAGVDLSKDAQALYESHPAIGAGLLKAIPRMEPVAAMVAEQSMDLHPLQPEGARFLKAAADYDLLTSKGLLPHEAYSKMLGYKSSYEPAILEALGKLIARQSGFERKYVNISDLNATMTLEEDIVTREGLLLMSKSGELNNTVIQRLLKAGATLNIVEPVAVRFPGQSQ